MKTLILMNAQHYNDGWKRLQSSFVILLLGITVMFTGIKTAVAQDSNFPVNETTFAQMVSSQDDSDNNLLSIQFANVTLQEALELLAEEINVGFSFNPDVIPEKKVSFSMSNVQPHEVIYKLLEGTNLEPILPPSKDVIVIREKKLLPAVDTFQQTITGTVVDTETDEPLPGVNVIAAGSENLTGSFIGTTTDMNGQFEIEVPDELNTLIFSYIGYQRLEVAIDGRSEFNVEMVSDIQMLEDIVVIGYGSQQKVNLTGAVDQVTSADIEGRPMQNLTQGLQGMLPNLNIDPVQGKPIESPAINIRGVTSIGQGGSALVLIDGVEGDPSLLNPRDIESISVLKDASAAAVYGARGAFGVVLIETKNARRDDFSITYSSNVGYNEPTVNQGDLIVDAYEWASRFALSFERWEGTFPRNVNKTLPFSEEYLAEIKRRSEDPSLDKTWVADDGSYRYAHSHNWYDDLYKDRNISMEHNLSISKGTDNARFVISGRYQDQGGLYRYSPDDYNLLNLRAKGSVDVTDWLEVNNNFSIANRTYFNPLTVGEGGNIWRNIADEGHPLAPMLNPDGTLTHSAVYTVGNHYYDAGGFEFNRNVLRNTTGFETQFFNEKLRVLGDFSFYRTLDEETRYRIQVPYSTGPGHIAYVGTEYNDLRVTDDKMNYLATNLYTQYEDTFGERHNVSAMIGYNYEESTDTRLRAFRNGLIFERADDLNLALGENVDTEGGYEKWAILGGFYRLNYIFDERYLLELSGRYDGSSKFPSDERYAFFPSASIGWRISSESFWNVPENIISHLQLRASYGSMGNGNIGAYVFQQTFGISQTDRILDGAQPRKTSSPAVLPQGLTWETATTRNLGIDLEMINNKLTFTGDVFVRETKDMFTIALTPPATFGANPPLGNFADLETKGWELSLRWRDYFDVAGDMFSYNVGFSLADSKAEITRYNNPDQFLNDYYVGMTIGEIWGYETEGFFVDQADIDNHADQSRFRSTSYGAIFPGDIKLRDLNGDGEIGPGDNTASNSGDQRIIGNTEPRYRIGINLGAEWKNFFVSAFFQGVLKQDWYPRRDSNLFWGQYNRPYGDIPAWHLKEGMIWTEENPSQDAFFPRYVARLANRSGAILRDAPQTRYTMDMKYIRMKNFQFGYNLPPHLTSKLGMRAASIYFSGTNLWTWAPFYDTVTNLDVESAVNPSDPLIGGNSGDGYNYPMLKSVNLGLSVTF